MLVRHLAASIALSIASQYCVDGKITADRNGSAKCTNGRPDIPCMESDIDESLNGLDQDDPRLIEDLKEYYVDKPAWTFPQQLYSNYHRPFGQFQQAKIVDEIFNHSRTNGFFVEAGAFDGQVASNTLFFELNRNWTGLLVEANPDAYEKLLSVNRNVWSLGHCLATEKRPHVVEFDSVGLFGGILQQGRVRPGDNLPERSLQHQEALAEHRKTIVMQCFPLYSILLAVGNPTVDYLSLDIEGAELAVLQTLPWDEVDIRVISLEVCRQKLNPDCEGDFTDDYDEITALLVSQGYRLHWYLPHTDEEKAVEVIFVREDVMNSSSTCTE